MDHSQSCTMSFVSICASRLPSPCEIEEGWELHTEWTCLRKKDRSLPAGLQASSLSTCHLEPTENHNGACRFQLSNRRCMQHWPHTCTPTSKPCSTPALEGASMLTFPSRTLLPVASDANTKTHTHTYMHTCHASFDFACYRLTPYSTQGAS